MKLTIAEMQNEVAPWVGSNFPNDTVETATLGVTEEAGELARAVLKRYQGIRGTFEEWTEEMRKELGDVFIKLCHVASLAGIDLEYAIADRWNEVRHRDWTTDKQGHGLPS